jgi:hypothetical protein
MPIHPMIMKYGDILFTDLWAVLDREKKLVAKMGTVEFHPKMVLLTPKQALVLPPAVTAPAATAPAVTASPDAAPAVTPPGT